MKSQRGSVLVGVLAMSIVLTIAASGYIMTATNNSGIEIDSRRDLQLHYAAEAGMLMGIHWTKSYTAAQINDANWPLNGSFVLTEGNNHFERINDMLVKVEFIPIPGGGDYKHQMMVTAKDGIHPGTLELRWNVKAAQNPPPPPLWNPDLSNWTEEYHPLAQ